MTQIHAHAELVARLLRLRRSNDPADDFLLAISDAGQADCLVTGDKAGLLALGRHGGAVILRARAFLGRLTG